MAKANKDAKNDRFFNKNKKNMSKEEKEIIRIIEGLKNDLYVSRQNLNIVTDEILIESYIYEIVALNKKYQYYIRLAKESGITDYGSQKIG